jgi:deoxyribonuclease V
MISMPGPILLNDGVGKMTNDKNGYRIHHGHRWDLEFAEARRVQEELERFVDESPMVRKPEFVAGADVSIRDFRVRAAVAVLSFPGLDVVDEAVWEARAVFPYVPGYLSFREIPSLLEALRRLSVWPDVIITDGQGRAHPRRFGLACHLGVLLDMPVFGVAKSRLTGLHEQPCPQKGCRVPLLDPAAQDCIGAVVRTRSNVKPVYVSVGHKVALEEAIDLTLRCAARFKLPEPTRQAHLLSRRWSS